MDPLDPALFAASSACRPCCGGPLTCGCALFAPIEIFEGNPVFGEVFPTYADAAVAMTGIGAECFAYAFSTTGFENDEGVLTAFTADNSVPNQLTVQTTMDSAGDTSIKIWWAASLALKAGAVVSMACTQVSGSSPAGATPTIWLFKCDGTYLWNEAIFGLPANFVLPAVAEDGEYILLLQCNTGAVPQVAVWNHVVTCTDTMLVNPVVALWDDAGTTRPLEACPKMLLPPTTESSGNWYMNATAAQDALDELASNCIGFIASLHPIGKVYTFDADFSGGVLTLETTNSDPVGDPGILGAVMYASVNAVGGETFTFTIHGTGAFLESGYIFDYTGTLVQNLPIFGDGSFATSAPLPYPGRYFFEFTMSGAGDAGSPNVSVGVTSSGTMTVNPLQALYDAGLDCPARLDCV